MPVDLYAPFELAWQAVKEFIETDGALPKRIAWISGRDLPKDTFPDPVRRMRDSSNRLPGPRAAAANPRAASKVDRPIRRRLFSTTNRIYY